MPPTDKGVGIPPYQRNRQGCKPRPEAILIMPAEGNTFANVLGRIRSEVSPSDIGANVSVLRKTWSGDILEELGSGIESKTKFGGVLRYTLVHCNSSQRELSTTKSKHTLVFISPRFCFKIKQKKLYKLDKFIS